MLFPNGDDIALKPRYWRGFCFSTFSAHPELHYFTLVFIAHSLQPNSRVLGLYLDLIK